MAGDSDQKEDPPAKHEDKADGDKKSKPLREKMYQTGQSTFAWKVPDECR
jgi:hypothetical protein